MLQGAPQIPGLNHTSRVGRRAPRPLAAAESVVAHAALPPAPPPLPAPAAQRPTGEVIASALSTATSFARRVGATVQLAAPQPATQAAALAAAPPAHAVPTAERYINNPYDPKEPRRPVRHTSPADGAPAGKLATATALASWCWAALPLWPDDSTSLWDKLVTGGYSVACIAVVWSFWYTGLLRLLVGVCWAWISCLSYSFIAMMLVTWALFKGHDALLRWACDRVPQQARRITRCSNAVCCMSVLATAFLGFRDTAYSAVSSLFRWVKSWFLIPDGVPISELAYTVDGVPLAPTRIPFVTYQEDFGPLFARPPPLLLPSNTAHNFTVSTAACLVSHMFTNTTSCTFDMTIVSPPPPAPVATIVEMNTFEITGIWARRAVRYLVFAVVDNAHLLRDPKYVLGLAGLLGSAYMGAYLAALAELAPMASPVVAAVLAL